VHPETAAALLPGLGISFYVIAVGSTGQVPIDYVDPFTKLRRTGSFDSQFSLEALAKIASAGGGTFIPAPSEESFNAAFERIDNEEITITRSALRGKKTPVHSKLVSIGGAALALSVFCKKFFLGAFL